MKQILFLLAINLFLPSTTIDAQVLYAGISGNNTVNLLARLDSYVLKKDMKIVCFGDSITIGSGAIGGGTSTGESYPEVLSNLIINFQNK